MKKTVTLTEVLHDVISRARLTEGDAGDRILAGISCGMEANAETLRDYEDTVGRLIPTNDIRSEIANIDDAHARAELQMGFESLTPAQHEAGRIIAGAYGDLNGYHKKATAALSGADAILPAVGTFGTPTNYMDASFEEFRDEDIRSFIAMSTVYNIQAARQDAGAEMLYKTVTLTPDNAVVLNKLQLINVYNAQSAPTDGSLTDWGFQPLIDAFVDHTILLNNGTQNIPVYRDDSDETKAKFISDAVVTPWDVDVSGRAVTTSFLKTGVNVDIIGLSQSTLQLAGGTVNETDTLDTRIFLTRIVTTTDGKAVAFNVRNLQRSSFIPSTEGNGHDFLLAFPVQGLVLNKDTQTVDSVPLSTLAGFQELDSQGLTVFLNANLTGSANISRRTLKVDAVELGRDYIVRDANGNSVQPSATLKAAIEALRLDGYEHYSARTNANRRTRGRRIDTQEVQERVATFLGAPFSTPREAQGQVNDTDVLNRLVNAVRISASNDAITNLLNHVENVRAYYDAYVANGNSTANCPRIEGLGQYLVKPFFREYELEVPANLNSLETKDLVANVSALLLNHIRVHAYDMLRDMRYLPALQVLTGSNTVKPKLGVLTDIVLPQYLQLVGDTRTLGINMEYQIAATPDMRFNNKIFGAFIRDGVDGIDPLAWGNYLFVPELAGTLALTINGAHYREAAVQPRRRHYHNLPGCFVINTSKLSEALMQKTKLMIEGAVTTAP